MSPTPPAHRRSYAALFLANALALLATGTAVVALALIAFDLAGEDAGAVLGTALAIKMLTFVLGPPLTAAFADRVSPRALMMALDGARALAILAVPFVSTVPQLFALIAVFTLASAAFMTAYQESIATLLTDPADHDAALSKGRIVYELETAASPLVAAALLVVLDYRGLFVVAGIALLVSAAMLATTRIPPAAAPAPESRWRRAVGGIGRILEDPRLRGLPFLALAVAGATAMVMVNTVVIVQGEMGLSSRATALALAVFGVGSVSGALILPRLLERRRERTVMVSGAAPAAAALALGTGAGAYATLLTLWFAVGLGAALAATPAARLIRRVGERHALKTMFAGSLAITHAALLVAYPLAGWLGAEAGTKTAFLVFAVVVAASALAAARVWPRGPAGAMHPEGGR